MDKLQEKRVLEQKLNTVKESQEARAERVRNEGSSRITRVVESKLYRKEPKHKGKDYDER
jgi:hypothetical protein